MKKSQKGVTLIALVITIIILLILAGVTINLMVGENGIFKVAEKSVEEYTKAQLKEELEKAILEIQARKIEQGVEMKREDLSELANIGATVNIIDLDVEGEYKNYAYTVDENYKVTIEEKLKGNMPRITAEVITTEEIVLAGEVVEIKVTASVEGGKIKSIEAVNGAQLKEDELNTDTEKKFIVTSNGTYKFKAVSDTGRNSYAIVEINKFEKSGYLLDEIDEITVGGVQTVSVTGKLADGTIKTEEYSLNVIIYNGDLTLDGVKQVEGATLSNSTYAFGSISDVASTGYAQNTVVLKVNGNLTINENITLTAVGSDAGYGGPKGLVIYCTGNLINNGTITMTARGAKAEGQNIFLWQNNDGSYEYVPAIGADGGVSKVYMSSATVKTSGNSGKSGSDVSSRATGGRWGWRILG